MELDDRLGNVLRQLREARGWSLSYVGEICGTSGANISKIERGHAKEYSLQLLKSLGAAYGLELYELVALVESFDATGKVLAPDQRKLIEVFKVLTATQRETLIAVALTLRSPDANKSSG